MSGEPTKATEPPREIERLRSALFEIARQRLSDEMDADTRECGAFEEAYETMILIARSALA